jgi:flagellar hook-associated protein 3 FlgL
MTMFYRTSSANAYDTAVRNITMRQSALSGLQENLTSGKRVLRPSDDPTSAALAERALTRINRIATDQRALEAQRSSIEVAESTLGSVTDAMQRFRELVVSAGNGVHSSTERKAIAVELQGLRDHIFSLANTQDANGQPLFSSLGSALAPFVGPQSGNPDYTFNGLPGQSGSSSVAIPFTLDGDSAFMLQPERDGAYDVKNSNTNSTLQSSGVSVTNGTLVTGSTYTISNLVVTAGATVGTSKVTYDLVETPAGTSIALAPVSVTGADYPSTASSIPIDLPGLHLTLEGTLSGADSFTIQPNASIFSVLDHAIADIGSAIGNSGASQAVAQALHNIDIGMQRISAERSKAGDLLGRADRISANQETRSIELEGDRSRAEDLDMVKGISDFQNQQTGYSAALQTYAQIQKLSLFNFIS